MTITVIIPTLNAEPNLDQCLKSIRNQTYPVEIKVVDGGSTDKTLMIAQKYGVEVLANPLKIAEFGVKTGILATKSDLVCVFAADNEFVSENALERINLMFEVDKSEKSTSMWSGYGYCLALWGRLVSGETDPSINKYAMLIQNDPLTWFLTHRNVEHVLWSKYKKVEISKPVPFGANGMVYVTEAIKKYWDKEEYVGDNDAFQSLVEDNYPFMMYYFHEPYVIHHHVKSLSHWIKKWHRNLSSHYFPHKRNMRWAGKRWKLKTVFWVPYVLFLSFPHSVYLAVRDKDVAWFWHFPCSLAQLITYSYESIVNTARV